MLQQSPLFFLTIWMAACHLMLQRAHDPSDSQGGGLVLAMAGNGHEFGLRVSGAAERWFVAPGSAPEGLRIGDATAALSPMVGDSGVIDAAGFGAQAFALTPALAELFAPWRRTADKTPDIHFGVHADLADLVESEPGLQTLRFGLDAHAIAAAEHAPQIAIAMLAADGRRGLAGRGIFSTPIAAFIAASTALGRLTTCDQADGKR